MTSPSPAPTPGGSSQVLQVLTRSASGMKGPQRAYCVYDATTGELSRLYIDHIPADVETSLPKVPGFQIAAAEFRALLYRARRIDVLELPSGPSLEL